MVIFLKIAFLVFCIRSLTPLICLIARRDILATDAWWHINVAKVIRERKHRIPNIMPRLKSSKKMGYPILYSWFLSFLPEKYLMELASFTGAICDILLYVLIIVVLYGSAICGKLEEGCNYYIIWTGLFFIFTPFFNRTTIGKLVPRARPLGVVFGTCSILFIYLFPLTGSILNILLSCIMFTVVTLTSRFAVQAVLAFSLLAGLFFQSITLVLFPVYAVLFSVVVTFGYNLRFLKGHAEHLILYWNKLYYDMNVSVKTRFYLPKGYSYPEIRKCLVSLYMNTFVTVFIGLPMLVPIFMWRAWGDNQTLKMFAVWLGSGLLLSLIVSIGKMKSFGQAERYLDYCVIPYVVLSVSAFTNLRVNSFTAILVGVYSLFMFFVYAVIRIKNYTRSGGYLDKIKEVFLWLDNISEKKGVLCIPLTLSRYGYFYTKHEFPISMTIDEISPDRYNKIILKYPYVVEDLTLIADQFGIDYVVGRKNDLTNYKPLGHVVFENDMLVVHTAIRKEPLPA